MDNTEKEKQFKFIRLCFFVMLAVFIIGNWYVTQTIAQECGYNEVLGQSVLHFQPPFCDFTIYQPLGYFFWKRDPLLVQAIPYILRSHAFTIYIFLGCGAVFCYLKSRSLKKLNSHGTADFATEEDIKNAKLTDPDNGVVCGRDPFTHNIMLHNGPEHILLLAPSRSGKGVGIITPTGIIWKYSMFFFDPKAELWNMTAGWRKRHHKQKVMKFEPLCTDGSAAKWNPFAEINFQSHEELSDVTTIANMMCKTGEKSGGDPFWENSAIALMNGIIMHLMYKHHQEDRPLPCPSDVMSFLSSPDMDTDHLFASMKIYPHISKEDFLELPKEIPLKDDEGNPLLDENGKQKTKTVQGYNSLKAVYGEYVADLKPFKNALGLEPGTEDWKKIRSLDDLKDYLLDIRRDDPAKFNSLKWNPPDIMRAKDKREINLCITNATNAGEVWYQLLVHPKVAESAANMLNGADQTRASIMQTAQTAMALYQDPLIRKNTAVSDFTVRDLLDPRQTVSLYLVLQPEDVDKLRPLLRLFVNTMLAKLVRDMKFGTGGGTTNLVPQRLLLMLDEFPQLGKMDSIENTLAICAGYGIKICIVAQDVSQLNKIYTKDNSIMGNCHVQIYFTPTNNESMKVLSDKLGDKTIQTVSHSDNGKIFGGSNSTSQQARKLMTPDEVSRMSQEKELVFVGGHRPIYGDKIRFYLEPYFKKRVQAPPPFSDTCTQVKTYEQLFAVHAADVADMKEKQRTVAEARAKADAQKKAAEAKQENPASVEAEEKAPVSEQVQPQEEKNIQTDSSTKEEATEPEAQKPTIADAPSTRPEKDLRHRRFMEQQQKYNMEIHPKQPEQKTAEPQTAPATSEVPATNPIDEQERFEKDVAEHAPKVGGLKLGYVENRKKAEPDYEPEKEVEECQPDAEAPDFAAEGSAGTGEGADSLEPAPEEGARSEDEEALNSNSEPEREEELEPPAEDNHGLGDPVAEAEAEARELDNVMANFRRMRHEEKQKKEQQG